MGESYYKPHLQKRIRSVLPGTDRIGSLGRSNELPRGGASKQAKPTGNPQRNGMKFKKRKHLRDADDADTPTAVADIDEEKSRINKALSEKDSAEALGDAIRERADLLREREPTGFERSVSSLGWALGASDRMGSEGGYLSSVHEIQIDEDSGGVEASPTSVVAHYFLKSHGGAHALQCLCSLLSSVAGIGALLFHKRHPILSLSMMKRSLLFAMIKHVSGLFAAALLTARAIPDVGVRTAREWMSTLVSDPVSQYVFYTACLLVWLPQEQSLVMIQKAAQDATSATDATAHTTNTGGVLFWQNSLFAPLIILGPVLLREIVSLALVANDVMVLLACSLSKEEETTIPRQMLRVGQACSDALMSILVTPRVWRESSSPQRQAILAKLASRVSLALEFAVGLLLLSDCIMALVALLFATQSRPALVNVVKRVFCTRLFWQFLYMRRRKIQRLALQMRGGAVHLPMYILQVLTTPRVCMGLMNDDENVASADNSTKRSNYFSHWSDYLHVILGFDDDE